MKKLLIASLIMLSSGTLLAESNSTIALPNKSDVKPTHAFSINLDPLLTQAVYNVTCLVTNNTAQNIDAHFEFASKDHSGYGLLSLNGEQLTYSQGSLKSGENTLSFAVASNGKGNSLVVKNLDFNSSIQLGNCVAKPMTDHVLNAQSGSGGGHFILTNNTDKTVTVGVGNVVPTQYKVPAKDWKLVIVSTNNQNIQVNKIE